MPIDAADQAVAAGSSGPITRTVDVDGVSYRMITVPLRSGGAIQVARSLTETDDVLEGLAQRLALIAVASTLGLAWACGGSGSGGGLPFDSGTGGTSGAGGSADASLGGSGGR